ncbi:hypothetical protein SAMN04487948_10748 [Halogranum amylolyticum]|uniref:Uncharacterized protein n=1 Tax=Halogranum amylolyticum TaxID=660520 RepID=A0A1H8TIC2_9EURY|nr:hypothetical protein [Halogranum amylolyticum]SEO90303.1 hypothetical protein SAMN04487948_10748 [Halogranum amylolyticum]
MSKEVATRDAAIEITEAFADSECVGRFGEITEVAERDTVRLVEFQTHTLSETYTHRIRITTSVGNVVTHDRSSRFD